MVEEKISFKVAVDDVLKNVCECTICCDVYRTPHLTKCGHSFCLDCITEVINRQHLCPECRAELTTDQLTRNLKLEDLIDSLVRERNAEKQKFFEAVVAKPIEGVQYSPIQKIFSENLKQGLLAYQGHMDYLAQQKDTLLH